MTLGYFPLRKGVILECFICSIEKLHRAKCMMNFQRETHSDYVYAYYFYTYVKFSVSHFICMTAAFLSITIVVITLSFLTMSFCSVEICFDKYLLAFSAQF